MGKSMENRSFPTVDWVESEDKIFRDFIIQEAHTGGTISDAVLETLKVLKGRTKSGCLSRYSYSIKSSLDNDILLRLEVNRKARNSFIAKKKNKNVDQVRTKRLTQREIGFTQGIAHAAALIKRYNMDAESLIKKSGIPVENFRKYVEPDEYCVIEEALSKISQ